MTTHRQWLAEYAASASEEAFRRIVEAYIGMVHGSALRLTNGNSGLAEDVVQIVFTDLARKAKTLSPEVIIGGWLHRRTCHAAANAVRGEMRRAIREREAAEMNTLHSDNAEAEAALADVAPALDDAINQLNDDDRNAILLRFFEKWNLRAIGESMGTTEGAAQKRIERALEKLRELLVRRGVVLSATTLALAMGAASATAAPTGLAATVSTAAVAKASTSASFSFTTLKFMAMTKLKIAVIASTAALLAAGTATTVILTREPSYTPPQGVKPLRVLEEIQTDTREGRYKEAFAKSIWFRENAVKIEPALIGVRDSFALNSFADLANKYPPAMEKLGKIRDQAEKNVKKTDAPDTAIWEGFLTAASINNGLKTSADTVELFRWIDAHKPSTAAKIYPVAEASLVKAHEYTLCGKYVKPDQSYRQMVITYHATLKSAARLKIPNAVSHPEMLTNAAVKIFSTQSATLVALLAVNNREQDADDIAAKAAKEVVTPEMTTLLADARQGKFPPSWP